MKIQGKLFSIILLSSSVLVLTMYLLTQWALDRGLLQYVNIREFAELENLAESLAERFREEGNWSFLQARPPRPHLRPVPPRFAEQPERRLPPPPPFNADGAPEGERFRLPPGISILTADYRPITGRYTSEGDWQLMPIQLENNTIGHLAHRPPDKLNEDFDLALAKQLKSSFIAASILTLLMSAALALPLSFFLLKRVKSVAQGAQRMANGDYSVRVREGASDELGTLAASFNHLASVLAANETARTRWIADISHELRTPLAIAAGELEAMQDGIRQPSPENLQSAHQEIQHLGRLVDDLYLLTNADIGAMNYHPAWIDFKQIITVKLDQIQPQADKRQLTLTTHLPSGKTPLRADPDRIKQLLDNLLVNAMKYTHPGGEIRIILSNVEDFWVLTIDDSNPGVLDEDLPHLFEPLYRSETSRNRQTGGSGLGLGICQRIVAGHQGDIEASHSRLGGLRITVRLPKKNAE